MVLGLRLGSPTSGGAVCGQPFRNQSETVESATYQISHKGEI